MARRSTDARSARVVPMAVPLAPRNQFSMRNPGGMASEGWSQDLAAEGDVSYDQGSGGPGDLGRQYVNEASNQLRGRAARRMANDANAPRLVTGAPPPANSVGPVGEVETGRS